MTSAVDLTAPNYSKALMHIATTGAARYAPLSATEPGEHMGTYPPEYVEFGWLGEDGLSDKYTEEAKDHEPFNATGPVLRRVEKETNEVEFTVWSNSGLVNALMYNVNGEDMQYDEGSGVVTLKQGAKHPQPRGGRFSFDILDGDKARRIFFPHGVIISREELKYKKGELTQYKFTVRGEIDEKLGYSVRREFKEGWQPNKSGTTLTAAAEADYGAWQEKVADKAN